MGVLRMESLLAMGILTAYGYSVALAFSGSTHVYFDTACAIVTLVLVGKTIERGAKEKTARALTLLYRLMPTKVRLLAEGAERFVSLEALQPGALFRVKSGERIPADGVVVEGRSHADESVLTGESAPRPKSPRRRARPRGRREQSTSASPGSSARWNMRPPATRMWNGPWIASRASSSPWFSPWRY